jgi:hypothetical protein
MSNFTVMTVFVVLINVLMWFVTIAMMNANPDLTGASMCYHVNGTIVGQTLVQNANGSYSAVNNDVLGNLPTADSSSVSAGTTNIFTDVFNSVLGWFTGITGIKYLVGVVSAPYNILGCMGLPVEFVAGIGTFWYLISLLCLIAFLYGGRD